MNILQFKRALPVLMRHRVPTFLWGSQGIGKTQSVKQYCKENGLDCRTLYTATQEVGDLIGLLVENKATGEVRHSRPEWFPTEGKGIIFLDELNRAPNEVIQALFSFVIDGKLHTHQLPEGWYVMAAGNYQTERFTTTDTSDAAWLSRFCHIDFVPSTEEWLVHAEDSGLLEIAQFIRAQPSMLQLDPKMAGRLDLSMVVPDPRSWKEWVGALENDPELSDESRYEVYSGLVGPTAAAAFLSYKAKAEFSLSLNHILKAYKGRVQSRVLALTANPKERRFDVLNQPLDELFIKLDISPELLKAEGHLENLKSYLLDIPKELAMKAFVRLSSMPTFYGFNDLLNDPVYVYQFNT